MEKLKEHYQLTDKDMSAAAYFAGIISSNILTAIQWLHEESPQTSREEMLKLITTTVTMGVFRGMEKQFSGG